ncbi:J domain-containing protein [Marinobacter sp. M216]|uniref:J domain-containing protein n=1 Tax=Marinobacter albus TaxID=3030833 RepID=A0ABT7HDG8_9GAMM|nr:MULTISPECIES: J domain-containing protein [unclassified Marinobacter]MBW7469779.1 J domain-containing protein [Marinobacter sp. F4218]MDK9557962.1 J domain-containing protein [Marinobacter sp. M216]
MNCWEILGIEPTGDRQRIKQAYEQQLKFASDDEARKLSQAFREATGGSPEFVDNRDEPPAQAHQQAVQSQEQEETGQADRPLDGTEAQVVREVVIQIKALMNDSSRSQDVGIWKAILCEPPADKLPIRREIARKLEPQVRPLAENGSLSVAVAHFLGGWFEWFSLQDVPEKTEERPHSETEPAEGEADQPPQFVNFWPAVIGWIVGLAILASLFSGMGGGG